MAYTTVENIRRAFTKLSVKVTDADLLVYVTKASDYLDAMLGGAFETPLTDYKPIITHLATDLAIFFYAEDVYSSQQPNLDEYYTKRYERVVDAIEKILAGELDIGVAPKDPATASGFASTNEDDPIFTLDKPYW